MPCQLDLIAHLQVRSFFEKAALNGLGNGCDPLDIHFQRFVFRGDLASWSQSHNRVEICTGLQIQAVFKI